MGVVTSLHSITQEYLDNSCLTALLHDAAEAYIGDIARPIKHSHIFKYIPEIEQQILGKIGNKFGLGGADWALIKKADNIMLATEAKALMKDKGEGWYLPEPALDEIPIMAIIDTIEEVFLYKFEGYGGKL